MKKIYIVLSYTGTILSKIIKVKTKSEFCHSSIALDKELTKMYSFGRLNPYNPFKGGFVQEYISMGTFKRFKKTKVQIQELIIDDDKYELIENEIRKIQENKITYKFNIKGLFLAGFDIIHKEEKSFYCAEFVKYILEIGKVDIKEMPNIIKPEHFKDLKEYKIIYRGLLRKYNVENIQTLKILEKILAFRRKVLGV